MRCPKCKDKVEEVKAGTSVRDHVLACIACSWQVAKRHLKEWLDKWRD